MSDVTGKHPSKGWFARMNGGAIAALFPFQYNPTRITRDRAAGYALVSPPGSPLPTATFQHISEEVISFTLMFDATSNYSEEQEGVGARIAELESFTQPEISAVLAGLGQFISPPTVRIGLGNNSWPVVIPKLKIREERFNSIGHVTRCYVDIQAKVYATGPSVLRSYLGRLDQLRSLVVIQGR